MDLTDMLVKLQSSTSHDSQSAFCIVFLLLIDTSIKIQIPNSGFTLKGNNYDDRPIEHSTSEKIIVRSFR